MPKPRAEPRLTVERARHLLSYNVSTGEFHWRVKPSKNRFAGERAGTTVASGHRAIRVEGETHYEHRLAWLIVHGVWPPHEIDHKDGDPANNRLVNLRLAEHDQNLKNMKRHKDNKSGYKGVSFHRGTGKWAAWIMSDGVRHYLGLFTSPELAHAAYCEAAERLHGAFKREA